MEHISLYLMNFNVISTALVFVVSFYMVRSIYKRLTWPHLPPGVPTVPILGSLPFLLFLKKEPPHKRLTRLAAKYGPVYKYYMGTKLVVVLNSREALEEALLKRGRDFSDRTYTHKNLTHENNKEGKGLIEGDWSPKLIKQRSICLGILKRFGFGRNIIENSIMEEAMHLVNAFSASNGSPVHVSQLIQISIANVICGLLLNKHYNYDDSRLKDFLSTFDGLFKNNTSDISWIPCLRFVPSRWRALQECDMLHKRTVTFVQEEFDEHRRHRHHDDPERDFVSAYKHVTGESCDPEMLLHIVINFFSAGTETSASALQFLLIFMANREAVQSKVKEEINQIIGTRIVSLADRSLMPYTEAVILETLRIATTVPLSVPHYTARDTQVAGYSIPKDTMIICNLWAIQMDPHEWPEPEEFRPERFLDAHGQLVNADRLVVFSMGRRACLGEPLAKQELFLFFVSIMQRFRVTPPPGVTQIPEEPEFGLTLTPQPFQLVLVED